MDASGTKATAAIDQTTTWYSHSRPRVMERLPM